MEPVRRACSTGLNLVDLHRGFVERYCNGSIFVIPVGKGSPGGSRQIGSQEPGTAERKGFRGLLPFPMCDAIVDVFQGITATWFLDLRSQFS